MCQHMAAAPEDKDGYAVEADEQLKDPSKIDWYHSDNDTVPVREYTALSSRGKSCVQSSVMNKFDLLRSLSRLLGR